MQGGGEHSCCALEFPQTRPALLPTLLARDLPGRSLQRQVHINLVVLCGSAQCDLKKGEHKKAGGAHWDEQSSAGGLSPPLTSRERMRYRTMRPRSTASVWLSKSGEFMPEGRSREEG